MMNMGNEMIDRTATGGEALGAALRSIRRERGWNLVKMSEVTGLSIATLSKVENGKRSLAYDKLSRLATSLKVDISRLFASKSAALSSVPTAGRRSVQRDGDGVEIATGAYTYTYLVQDLISKKFSPVMMDLHARTLDPVGRWQ